MPAHVFLVPGFFGFANVGELKYFAHVRPVLAGELDARGVDHRIHYVRTRPTAGLDRRAQRLLDTIEAEAGPGDPIHLIGHSTGGLDARMAACESQDPRIETVLCIATPHQGAPLASFFERLEGQRLLGLLSLLGVRVARSHRATFRMAGLILDGVRLLQAGRALSGQLSEQITRQLLADFDADDQAQILEFLTEVSRDQSLISQLTPTGLRPFAPRLDVPGHVRRGSVVARARRPGLEAVAALGFDATLQALHQVFRWLQTIAAGSEATPAPTDWQGESVLSAAFGDAHLPARDNDGIVPARSQLWGQIVHAAWADHLDVIGHFSAPRHEPPHYDWLPSGSGYRRPHFEALWTDIADFLTSPSGGASSSPEG